MTLEERVAILENIILNNEDSYGVDNDEPSMVYNADMNLPIFDKIKEQLKDNRQLVHSTYTEECCDKKNKSKE